jgi:hypothetical protein
MLDLIRVNEMPRSSALPLRRCLSLIMRIPVTSRLRIDLVRAANVG